MSAAIQLPAPEIVEGAPFEQYIETPEVHATALRDMLTSPLLYKFRREQPRPDSDTFRVGRAGHTAILEPDRFMLDYALWRGLDEDGNKQIRRGKKWDNFREVNDGRTTLTEKQYMLALRLRNAVQSHPVAGKYLAEKGRSELTLKWTHARTGLRCKARLDRLCSALIDVKTTRDPSPHKFSSDAARYGYAMQLAFYADGAVATGLGMPPVKIIAVQSVEPHDVVVYDIPESVQAIGREQIEGALDKLVECTRSGVWPGIASDEVALNLPAWAAPEAEEITFGDEVIS